MRLQYYLRLFSECIDGPTLLWHSGDEANRRAITAWPSALPLRPPWDDSLVLHKHAGIIALVAFLANIFPVKLIFYC